MTTFREINAAELSSVEGGFGFHDFLRKIACYNVKRYIPFLKC